jgi:adenylosuccinate synthase
LLGKKIKGFVFDSSLKINELLEKRKLVLFESAQGTFLDNSFGTYPFVTSSQPLAGSALAGTGINHKYLTNVIGIAKAYTTRVGSGFFITEQKNNIGKTLREKGQEFGTTTGRPRRIGWLDLVLIRTAKRLNGLTELALTKLDVLSGLKELKVCYAYKCKGKLLKEVPAMTANIIKCRPIYKKFNGFEINGTEKSYNELPLNARKYIEFIEKELKIKVKYIGIGAERSHLIIKK